MGCSVTFQYTYAMYNEQIKLTDIPHQTFIIFLCWDYSKFSQFSYFEIFNKLSTIFICFYRYFCFYSYNDIASFSNTKQNTQFSNDIGMPILF
jgi:hypothetical protein